MKPNYKKCLENIWWNVGKISRKNYEFHSILMALNHFTFSYIINWSSWRGRRETKCESNRKEYVFGSSLCIKNWYIKSNFYKWRYTFTQVRAMLWKTNTNRNRHFLFVLLKIKNCICLDDQLRDYMKANKMLNMMVLRLVKPIAQIRSNKFSFNDNR